MRITITGPRSVGKTIISKKLSKILSIPYFSGDNLMTKRLKEYGTINDIIRSKKFNLIFENSIPVIKEAMQNESFIFDFAGGGIKSSKYPKIIEKSVDLIKASSYVIGLLPFLDVQESIDFLFEREQKRIHFKNDNKEELYSKVNKDYLKLIEVMPNVCDKIFYINGRDSKQIREDIAKHLHSLFILNDKEIKNHYLILKKKNKNIKLNDAKKNYFVRKILFEWNKLSSLGQINELNKLILKGGALLSEKFLSHHRLSQELDFVCSDYNFLEKKLKKDNITKIELFLRKIFGEIDLICKNLNLNFIPNLQNNKYVEVKKSGRIYRCKIYYDYGYDDYIGFDINFSELLSNNYKEREIGDLCNFKNKMYSLEESALEKFRTIFTRTNVEMKDIFDLYCINRILDIFKMENALIMKKINFYTNISEKHFKNFSNRKKDILNSRFEFPKGNVNWFSLIEINLKDFDNFKNKLLIKIEEICITNK